jgi:outer membrane protein assembly factor BamB
VDGDRLICTPGANDGIIAALNKKTGEVIWKAGVPAEIGSRGRDGAGYSSVVISNGAGVKQYLQLVGRGVISVRAEDGKTLWTYNRVANGTANIPTPVVKGDYVFCSSGYGTGAALLKLVPAEDGVTAEEVYFLDAKTMQNHHGGMILLGDYIYCGHGHNNGFPLCIEMLTGEVAWSPGRGAGSGSAAVAYADGHFYFRYQDGVMALIEATPKEYVLKGTFKIGINHGPSWPHPVICEGRLYLRDQDELVCYDLRKSAAAGGSN